MSLRSATKLRWSLGKDREGNLSSPILSGVSNTDIVSTLSVLWNM